MKKRYFFVVLIAVLALMLVLLMLYPADSLCDISTAEINNNNGRWTKVRPVNGDEYLYNSATGKKIAAVYSYDSTGSLRLLTLDEGMEIKNSLPLVVGLDSNGASRSGICLGRSGYDYYENYIYQALGSPIKITPDFSGPCEIHDVELPDLSGGFGGDITITCRMAQAIKKESGFPWTFSLTGQTGVKCQFQVPAEETGYIQFLPYYNVTMGKLYKADELLGYAMGLCPICTPDGHPAGIIELVLE